MCVSFAPSFLTTMHRTVHLELAIPPEARLDVVPSTRKLRLLGGPLLLHGISPIAASACMHQTGDLVKGWGGRKGRARVGPPPRGASLSLSRASCVHALGSPTDVIYMRDFGLMSLYFFALLFDSGLFFPASEAAFTSLTFFCSRAVLCN